MKYYARYYGSKTKGWFVEIYPTPDHRNRIASIKVSGKVEARKVARANNALPYNF